MRWSRLFFALLAVMAICVPAAPPAWAQAGPAPTREKAGAAPSARPVAARPPQARTDTAQASKSVSARLFDAGWVIFPARLALVIVCVTVALFLAMCGTWSALRVAHSLWHTEWSEPPRQLKRGELGAAGTSLALEWEERFSTNTENDRERDAQIAWLEDGFNRVTKDINTLAARVTTLEIQAGVRSHERTGDTG